MVMRGNISPYKGEEGIACLPRKTNVSEGREGWESAECENCGAECWRNVELINQAKKLQPNLKELCTTCAIQHQIK